MAEKVLKTRLQQKYGTHAEWKAANPTLKAGEIAVVVVPAEAGAVVQEPTVLIKVGDGVTNYEGLSFIGALAADVHDWAKEASKPSYAATEITGIGDYIANYVDETLGISVDTDTQYRIVAEADGVTFKLQSKAKGEADTAFADVAGSTFTVDHSAVLAVANEAKEAAAAAQKTIDDYKTANDAEVQGIKTDLSTNYEKKTDAEAKLTEAKGYTDTKMTEADGKFETKTDAQAKLTEAKGYTDTKISELLDGASDETLNSISELATAIKENDSAIDALNSVAGSKAAQTDLDAAVERIGALETDVAEKANDADLAAIAKTGSVADLVQNDGDILVFNCGGPAIGTADEYNA